jgi:glycosyltransferase involved in cell wall biosynthesis
MSGGDYHILKVAEYWAKDNDIEYMLPRLGCEYAKNHLFGKVITYHSPIEKETSNILKALLMYLLRLAGIVLTRPEGRYDVIVSSSHYMYDILPAVLLRRKNTKCRVVAFCHGLLEHHPHSLSRFVRVMNNSFFIFLAKRLIDLVFVINPMIRHTLEKSGVSRKRILLARNGVDDIKFAESDLTKKKFDACFMGRLIKVKGVYDLLEIWESVIQQKPNSKLIIIGDGLEMAKIKDLIKVRNLCTNIIMTGYMNDSSKFEALRLSRLFLLPSYAEAYPVVVTEAMSCGLPVISYDLPELRAIWKDEILWIRKGSRKEFAEAVLYLLKEDKNYYRFLSKGIQRAKHQTWEKIAEEEMSIIKSSLLDN